MARILIVEDDPLMLRMYQKVFTLEKYEVDIAENGEEALEKVRTYKPTLILMDIMMPKMNGLDALDKLKANPDTAQIPVIMLTNLAGQKDAEEALLKGAVKYIVKSEHDPKQVVDLVKEILAGYTRDKVPEAVADGSAHTTVQEPSTPPEDSVPPQVQTLPTKEPSTPVDDLSWEAPSTPTQQAPLPPEDTTNQ